MQWLRVLVLVAVLPLCAGAQWEVQESHTTASLRGIYAVVETAGGLGFGVGRDGAADGRWRDERGSTVRCRKDAEALDFRGVQAFDERRRRL